MTTTDEMVQARVSIDARRYDVVIVSLDKQRQLHVAVHVRESFAHLIETTDGEEKTALQLLDAKGVPQRRVEVYVSAANDVEIVTPPYRSHDDAAPMLEKLRIAAGL